jgi:hypothetical protein
MVITMMKNRAYKIQDFSLKNQNMKSAHYLFNAGVPIPPMEIKKIDIRSP